jgi:hypothetical protein
MKIPDSLPVFLGDNEYWAEFDYTPGRPGKMYLSNGDPGYPDEPEEITLIRVFGSRHDLWAKSMHPDTIADVEQQIREQIAELYEAEQAERAERERDYS